jgi:hypothetical protein
MSVFVALLKALRDNTPRDAGGLAGLLGLDSWAGEIGVEALCAGGWVRPARLNPEQAVFASSLGEVALTEHAHARLRITLQRA